LNNFLQPRGLELSEEKTRVSHINDGFDFLGFNLRKYNGKLLIKPAKQNVHTFLAKTRELIKSKPTANAVNLIRLLNPKIQGWANYYRHVVSKKCFSFVDYHIDKTLWRWVHRRHTNKGVRWKQKRYYCKINDNNWRFYARVVHQGKPCRLVLLRASYVGIKRHIKIRADSNPFNPEFNAYLAKRQSKRIFSEELGR
jgi:RNA-directed DNA polymerase